MAATSEETQRLFLETLSEQEARTVPRSEVRKNWRVALGAGLVLAAVVGFALTAWPGAPALVSAGLRGAEVMSEKEPLIEAFGKCGGQGWTNGTCCEKGCACVAESKYYSGCKTPAGLNQCDFDRAKVEEEAAKMRVTEKEDNLMRKQLEVKVAAKALKGAKDASEQATEDFKKAMDVSKRKDDALRSDEAKFGRTSRAAIDAANEELDKITRSTKADLEKKTQKEISIRDKKLQAAHTALADAKKAFHDALAAFHAADKKAAAKEEERSKVKAHVDKYEKAEKVRKDKKCPGLFGDCTASNCCKLGCQPYWQNKFFCQCEGPRGEKYCAWKEEVKEYDDATKAMPTLTSDYHKLNKANDTASAKFKDAESNLKKVTAQVTHDIAAAKKEFTESTKEPAAAADDKLSAAKDVATGKIQKAKDALQKKTAAARAAAKAARDTMDRKKKVAQEKHEAVLVAKKDANDAARMLDQAETELKSAKSAVGSWRRASSGNTCGQEDDF